MSAFALGVRVSLLNSSLLVGSLAVGSLVLLAACGGEDECSSGTKALSFEKKSSLGFSLAQVLENREGQRGPLVWSTAPDWLSYNAEDGTDIVSIVTYDDAKVNEVSGSEEDCQTVVSSSVNIEVNTVDGQLHAVGEGEITATKKNTYSLRAVFTSSELSGALQIGNNGRLFLDYEIKGDLVVGTLKAAATEEDDMTSRVRQATIARWEGTVGEVALTDSPTQEVPEGDLVTDE